MSQTEKMDKTKECAEIVRNVMKENGKEISDYDLGYMMGKVDGVTERRANETEGRSSEGELSQPKADLQTAGDLGAKGKSAV